MPIIRDPPKVHSAARSHADEKLRAVLIREGDFEDVGLGHFGWGLPDAKGRKATHSVQRI